jgi:hypothetical protein
LTANEVFHPQNKIITKQPCEDAFCRRDYSLDFLPSASRHTFPLQKAAQSQTSQLAPFPLPNSNVMLISSPLVKKKTSTISHIHTYYFKIAE